MPIAMNYIPVTLTRIGHARSNASIAVSCKTIIIIGKLTDADSGVALVVNRTLLLVDLKHEHTNGTLVVAIDEQPIALVGLGHVDELGSTAMRNVIRYSKAILASRAILRAMVIQLKLGVETSAIIVSGHYHLLASAQERHPNTISGLVIT